MKKIVSVLFSVFAATYANFAYANCTTQTFIMPDGKMMICTTCCNYGNCTTTCI